MLKEKLPWIITAIMAALLIIVSFLWLDAARRLDNGNLSAQRDLIREYCSATDEESRTRCQEEIADMTAMLKQFNKDLRAQDKVQAQVQVETTPIAPTGQ